MASPHFEVLRCSGHLLEPAVLQVSSLEEWEVMERSGVLRVCMNVCNFMLWELARGRGREGRRAKSRRSFLYQWDPALNLPNLPL